MNRVGIMGGTFDPIHLGHLAAAEAARASFSLEKVIFVPTGNPPHKAGRITPSHHRLEMVKIATADNPYFEVSDVEVFRPGKSYTIDTIDYFQNLIGNKHEIFFITGADAILEILTWHDVERLMQACKFIAVARPGYALNGLNKELSNLPEYIQKRISVLEVKGLHISSTQVRSDVQSGKSIHNVVPETVADYIYKHNLYKILSRC